MIILIKIIKLIYSILPDAIFFLSNLDGVCTIDVAIYKLFATLLKDFILN
jgi:hypothetical protein